MHFGRRMGIVLLLASLAGCAASPWSSKGTALASTTANKPEATSPSQTASQITPASPGPGSPANPQTMQEVMAELKQLGGEDPQSQQKFLADLQQTDPALWPLLLQQMRATKAYRKRFEEGTGLAGGKTNSGAAQRLPAAETSGLSGSVNGAAGQADRSAPAPSPYAVSAPPGALSPLPSATGGSPSVQTIYLNPQQDQGPKTILPAGAVEPKPNRPTTAADQGAVQKASFEKAVPASMDDRGPSPAEGAWRNELNGAIRALEARVSAGPKSAEDFALQARLRTLYALAGRREEAARPIADAPVAVQDFWSKELFGLTVLWDEAQTADPARRAAESKLHLSDALARLGESAPLLVRNLTFCTAVQSFGCFTAFKKYEFAPGQEALLYAEVENFTSQSTPKGYHTALQSSYQILDARGQRIADHVFTTTEEYCQNHRRDFFIGYHLRLPAHTAPGRYTLQLTIEDLKSKKVGQASLEFTVKSAEK